MTTTVQHAITINTFRVGGIHVYRALCLCGFSGQIETRADALAAGDRHLQQPVRVPVPAIVCRPWCMHGDGHPDEVFADDQRCETYEQRVDLGCHEPIDMSDGKSVPDCASVYAQERVAAESGVEICVHRLDELPTRYTPAEAQELIEALQLVLGQVKA